jgi:hypothetical protein
MLSRRPASPCFAPVGGPSLSPRIQRRLAHGFLCDLSFFSSFKALDGGEEFGELVRREARQDAVRRDAGFLEDEGAVGLGIVVGCWGVLRLMLRPLSTEITHEHRHLQDSTQITHLTGHKPESRPGWGRCLDRRLLGHGMGE